MDLSIKWNKKQYQEFLKYLKACHDEKYKKFQEKLLKDDKIKVIGIRIPILRKMAKEITDIDGFIKYNTHKFFEENLLQALVIARKKDINYVKNFIKYIDNWAVNDTFACSLKQFKNLDINEVKIFLNSPNPWSVRFALTLLLNYYVNDKYIDEVLAISNSINNSNYYVKMANSWLLQVCYVKFKEKTTEFFKTTTIDDFTYNKAISKICDSYKVSKENKINLRKMRR